MHFSGIVVFFGSYTYEANVVGSWQQSGMLSRIDSRKRVFREPTSQTELDAVLLEYQQHIYNPDPASKSKGAVLLCVVGGKLSEGINFADGLARCVLMVGLPYANRHDAELCEKMRWFDEQAKLGRSLISSDDYYQNLCMKAVNQSIGRAIRHAKDYAVIVLADQRYLKPSVQTKLPSWMLPALQQHSGFGASFGAIASFFRTKTTVS